LTIENEGVGFADSWISGRAMPAPTVLYGSAFANVGASSARPVQAVRISLSLRGFKEAVAI